MPEREPKITVIGGGTGSFTLLNELKHHTGELTALVNMADNGGSTGVLRDELGVLPPGDVRQCLVALSEAPRELRDLFTFRFPGGSLEGHSFGNLFLSAVESMTDDFDEAVRLAGDVLRIKGRVLPVTLEDCHLVLEDGGRKIIGEQEIARSGRIVEGRPNLSLEPPASVTAAAKQAIVDADLVVIAPGNLYGSLAPALLPHGVGEAIQESSASTAFICNLVNKPDFTHGYAVHDYASEIERFIGGPALDFVLYNHTPPEETALRQYMAEEEYPVAVDSERLDAAHYRAIGAPLVSAVMARQDEHDTLLRRSLIRHDAKRVAEELLRIS